MQEEYNDYSNHIGLRLCHSLRRIRYFPLPGFHRIVLFLSNKIPKPRSTDPCIIKTIHGFRILIDPALGEGLERSLFEFGTYEEGTLRILDQILRNGGVFIDIGANIGLMSLHAADILKGKGTVLSFEPLPSTFAILQKNIGINHNSNIHAINKAIGSKKGIVDIYENPEMNRGAASIIKPNSSESSFKIPIISLDEYLTMRGSISPIKCLKLDVEGWELEVLKGAKITLSDPNAPICILEYSKYHKTYGGENHDIYTYLQNINSYRLFRLERGKERPSKLIEIKQISDLPKHDNLFCFLQKHIDNLPSRIFS